MVTYKIVVKNSAGEMIGEFDQFRSLQFGKKLNGYGSCSFEVPVNNPKIASLIALRQYTVWVFRDEDLVWAGEQASRIGSLKTSGDNWVTVYCYDWFEQLGSRYTPDEVTYTGIDAGQIAWALIDDSQSQTNGDLGLTEGTIEPTQNRDRTYYNKNIADCILELANVINGFDFEINSAKQFQVFESIGVDRSDSIVLEYGINITTMSITEDFSKPVNRAIVLGDSGVPSDPLRIEREDLALQVLYSLREGLINDQTVAEIASLEEEGDALVRKLGTTLLKLTIGIVRSTTPTIVDFALGDLIRLRVKTGIYDLDQNFRVFEWRVSYQTDNTEVLNLTLGNFTN